MTAVIWTAQLAHVGPSWDPVKLAGALRPMTRKAVHNSNICQRLRPYPKKVSAVYFVLTSYRDTYRAKYDLRRAGLRRLSAVTQWRL